MSSNIEDDILENAVQTGMVCIINQQEEEIKELREQVKLLREVLELSTHALHEEDEYGECLCSQCGFVKARDMALEQTKPKE